MPEPKDAAELALVLKAIELSRRFQGYCEWKESSARRLRERPPLEGLTPEGIKEMLGEFVVDHGGEVTQVEEKRSEYKSFRYFYKATIPIPGSIEGLFVEIVLVDDDPDDPAVLLVNAH